MDKTVADKKVGQTLLKLSQIDEEVFELTNQKSDLETRREVFLAEINDRRERLQEAEAAHKEGSLRQVLEEHRLRDEEQKIVERRKKLSLVAGAKVAKLLEREIDISSKSIQSLEERAVKAMEEVDELEGQLGGQKEVLEQLETQFEDENVDIEGKLTELLKQLKSLDKDRKKHVNGLNNDRLARLYERVRKRYNGSPVARSTNGSCRRCYRALPPQTYNQILAGNMLIQCPGCSRILVYIEEVKK